MSTEHYTLIEWCNFFYAICIWSICLFNMQISWVKFELSCSWFLGVYIFIDILLHGLYMHVWGSRSFRGSQFLSFFHICLSRQVSFDPSWRLFEGFFLIFCDYVKKMISWTRIEFGKSVYVFIWWYQSIRKMIIYCETKVWLILILMITKQGLELMTIF